MQELFPSARASLSVDSLASMARGVAPASPEIADRVLRQGGPALLFERPTGHEVPVLVNLFGTTGRVALGMGVESMEALHEIGRVLAFLKEQRLPAQLLVNGGYVRDLLLGKTPDDLDLSLCLRLRMRQPRLCRRLVLRLCERVRTRLRFRLRL